LGVLPSWTEIPAIILVASGGALLLVCFGVFVVRGRGTPLPLDPPTKLVAFGPYKYVRNPIHIAWLTLFIGLGLYLRSPSILLFALAFFAICYVYVLWVEEPSLKKRFGTEYEEYCKVCPDMFRGQTPGSMYSERIPGIGPGLWAARTPCDRERVADPPS